MVKEASNVKALFSGVYHVVKPGDKITCVCKAHFTYSSFPTHVSKKNKNGVYECPLWHSMVRKHNKKVTAAAEAASLAAAAEALSSDEDSDDDSDDDSVTLRVPKKARTASSIPARTSSKTPRSKKGTSRSKKAPPKPPPPPPSLSSLRKKYEDTIESRPTVVTPSFPVSSFLRL
jgi:hypothetical protein